MADVMFVNNPVFVITFERGIELIMMEFTPKHTTKQPSHNLIKVI